MANAKLKVTLTGSYIGCTAPQRGTLKALGLRKRGQMAEHEASPSVEGMLDKVKHLVSVETVS